MALTEIEQAFAENMILLGAATGPQLLYPIALKATDPRPLWEILDALQVAGPQVVAEARSVAEQALAACGPQAFSFSEGAMVGSWELVGQRGSGPGGAVWLAQRAGQQATLRLVPPGTGHDAERGARFVERSNAGLDPPHPAILKIDEAEEDFGWLYTVTVGMDCRSLAGLRQLGPLPEQTAIALAQSLAGSLAVIHDLGVVHGGLSPLGVLVLDQRIYLSDFGVSGSELDGPREGCRPGGRLGVLLYASPGLISGDAARGLDARDDLYALGAVTLSAVQAPNAGSPRAAPDAPWLVEPPVSDGLRAVLRRLLALNPDACYPDARAVLGDLNRVAAGGMPAPLAPSQPGGVRGRRAETAASQELVRADMFERLAAPTDSASDLSLPSSALSGASPGESRIDVQVDDDDLDRTVTEDIPVFEIPKDLRESASRRLKAPPARSRSERVALPERKSGGGWALLAFTLLVVLGGGGVGVALTRPVGPSLGYALLTQAEAIGDLPAPDYGRAWELTQQALDAGSRDVRLVQELIACREQLNADALTERAKLLPEGDGARDPEQLKPKLEALGRLLRRLRKLPAEHLVQFDVYLGAKEENRHFWGELADALLAAGRLDESLIAYMKADSKKGEALVRRAQAELAFVAGGPYVVTVDGEPAVVTRRPCYVGRTEVTRGQYAAFLEAIGKLAQPHTHCDTVLEPADKSHQPEGWKPGVEEERGLPATGLDFHDALAYCAWKGDTLADPATLVAAARGPLGRRFPWGEGDASVGLVNAGGLLKGVAPGGCFPGGAGQGGALDLLGNVEEWTASKDGGKSSLFGGHYDTPLAELVVGPSGEASFAERRATLGFRVMRSLSADK